MSQLKLYLLGPPHVEYDGQTIEVKRRKSIALLAYLAVTAESHNRDELAAMFWPDSDQSRARAALRSTLWALNKTDVEAGLEVDQEMVGLNPEVDLWLDVAQFQRLLASGQSHDHPPDAACPACLPALAEAAALYRDDFMVGFTLRDSPDFDEWQFFQSEKLRQQLASVLERLVQGHTGQGQFEPALAYARRWLALDPLNEAALHHLMLLYAWSGQQAAALRQYQVYERALDEELDVSPGEALSQLYQALRAKRVPPAPASPSASPAEDSAAAASGVDPEPQPAVPPAGAPPAPAEPSPPPERFSPDAPTPATAAAPTEPPAPAAAPVRDDAAAEIETPTEVEASTGVEVGTFVAASTGAGVAASTGGPVEGELRIVTALLAGISSSLDLHQGLQPEEFALVMNRLLRAMEAVLTKYGARVDNVMGSTVLAVFGAPSAHEDDPERAIRAALDLQQAAQELGLEITIGINTGEVYVGQMASETRRQGNVLGPAVNLAERLQAKAGPGQILAGETTYRLTRRAFKFSRLTVEFSGMAGSVTAYRVVRPWPDPEKSRGIEGLAAPLIGRDVELAQLKTTLAELLRGQGQMVSLIGEAGVGKSRLAAELKQMAQQEFGLQLANFRSGDPPVDHSQSSTLHSPPPVPNPQSAIRNPKSEIIWLEGRCLEMAMSASYWPFIDLFRAYFAWGPGESKQTRAGYLLSALREMVEQGALSTEQFQEMGPVLGNLLSVHFGHEWDERLRHVEPEQIQHRTFTAIHDFFVALAQQRPVLLVLEDLHWADGLSIDLLSLLMEALPLGPLFLLCVYRSEREHKSWHLPTIASRKCPERYTELPLRELTPQQSSQLVGTLLSVEDLSPFMKALILEKSQGNPFFVEEILRSLIDAGIIYREGQTWRARPEIDSMALPESVQSVILSRVDRLEPELKQLLQYAAVIGRLFRRRVLARVAPSETRLEDGLWTLEDHALIYQERTVPEEEYSFKHVLTQETVYQTIPQRRRVEFHRRVAEAIEALYRDRLERYYEQLAYHYGRSDRVDKAVEYLLKAGEKVRRAYLNEEALCYFQEALDRLEEQPQKQPSPGREDQPDLSAGSAPPGYRRLELLRGLGQVALGLGKLTEAEEYFRQTIALGQKQALSGPELVRLYYWLGEALFWQGRYDEQIRIGQEGLALLGPKTESVEAALMNQEIAIGHEVKGDEEKFREYTHRTARFIRELPYSEELRPAYTHIVSVYIFDDKNLDEAAKWLELIEQKAHQHHDLTALAESHHVAGLMLAWRGDLHGAISREQRALEIFTKIGEARLKNYALRDIGGCFLLLGDLPQAETYTRRALDLAEAAGSKRDMAEGYETLGAIFLSRQMADQAVEALEKAADLLGEIGSPYRAEALVSLGRAYLARGRGPEARRQFEAAVEQLGLRTLRVRFWKVGGWRSYFVDALSGLEATSDEADRFQDFCRRFRKEQPQAAQLPFVRWFLEPAQIRADFGSPLLDFGSDRDSLENLKSAIRNPQSPWSWQDPFGECSFMVQNGLEIYAVNGRDMGFLNLSAPRLLHPVRGDFAVQTVCGPISAAKPAQGGLLLWQDEQNFLRLDRGSRGEREISFGGCLENKDRIIGRGRLPFAPASFGAAGDSPLEVARNKPDRAAELRPGPNADRIHLRLERLGNQIEALCSADGLHWFTVGQVEFPLADPIQAGLHAIGHIDRTLYHGPYPEGTAIRFESFQLWAARANE